MSPLQIVFAVLLATVGLGLIVAWLVAEIRAARWARTPDPDPWVKRYVR